MRKITAICILLTASGASAFQSYTVKNGDEITASVYKSGLSRIYLQDDRISAIKAMAGEFQIDKNDEIGDIYLKPLSTRSSDELDLFIQSERGNTYSLRLKVNAVKPESIRLDAQDFVEKTTQTQAKQASNDPQEEIIQILKIVSLGREIKGYSSEVYSDPSSLRLNNNVVSILEKVYKGKNYRVDVLRIENHTDNHINIHERDLAELPNVVAISIEKHSLAIDEGTKAYRVIKL